MKELNTGLHVTILLLLFLALALALVSMGFAILNMIQVPYRAVNGPGGICLWNVLAGKEALWGKKVKSCHHQAGLCAGGKKLGRNKNALPGPSLPRSKPGIDDLGTKNCEVSPQKTIEYMIG